jgi:deoxycytidine triphosphate deaminase
MILTGKKIIESVLKRKIIIEPFQLENVNPNSYNFRLDKNLRVYKNFPLDPKKENESEHIEIPPDGYVLMPNRLYLANTLEILGSTHYAPTFNARSSIARLGMFINLSATLCDIGFVGQLTLQLFCVNPIRIYPYINIGQMMFWKPVGTISIYSGKYQGSSGPQTTKIYQDFIKKEGAVKHADATKDKVLLH